MMLKFLHLIMCLVSGNQLRQERDDYYIGKLQSEEDKVVTFQFPKLLSGQEGRVTQLCFMRSNQPDLFHIFPRAVNSALLPIISIGKPSSFLVGRSIYTSISPSREA